ncbi:probable indole-3-pyruvate monooxygenase YUCCA11 [Prosopis cineraria]|uniref:probable indole-3-pyruvate monooxygenase YUCCA11 n=1 Tax=Prosopis cineraria TaxID=364024 RepID=UPI00240FA2EF|nr:probable indole-3-pyruvate monooxygenase YUCCA11 [Prosopis cineraria]
MEEVQVVIVGGGPAGIAASACLNRLDICNVVLEGEDCHAPLWRKRTYDRVKLHLAKEFCGLPYMPFPPHTPTFVPRVAFMRYLDDYVHNLDVKTKCNRFVESASIIDENNARWKVVARNILSDATEVYISKFLVVATGENNEGYIPDVPGLSNFEGQYMHSSEYLNGRDLYDKNVLVVGCGNSGMEIAYDLTTWGANASIVVRSPVHIVTKEMIYIGMRMHKFFSVKIVDKMVVLMSKIRFGNLSRYGIRRPREVPFSLKSSTGRSPTIDVGCVDVIKKGIITVFPGIRDIRNKVVEFDDGRRRQIDVIIFATGYKSNVLNWLKDYESLFKENGMPKRRYPDHWRAENGLYCAGFGSRGLQGISDDAKQIANDINFSFNHQQMHCAVPVN